MMVAGTCVVLCRQRWWSWLPKILIFVLLASAGGCSVLALAVCPSPLPCYCIGNQMYEIRIYRETYLFTTKLDVSENFIVTLPADGLSSVQVQTVRLTRNTLRHISTAAFRGLVAVKQLDLALKGVKQLDLSHNQISHLPGGVFSPLTHLRTLKLRYNRLADIGPQAFHSLHYLSDLDLQGNLLTSVPSEALRHLRRLRQLNLRHNRLRLVHPFAFYGLQLRQLDLGDNIAPLSVHRDAFCGLEPQLAASDRHPNRPGETTPEVGIASDLASGLSELRLDHNGLTTLSACLTTDLWTLKTVHIAGNPLHCDCRLLQLASSKTSFPGAQCAQPITRAGLFLDSVGAVDQHHECRHWQFNGTQQLCRHTCHTVPPPGTAMAHSSSSSSSSISVFPNLPLFGRTSALRVTFLVLCVLVVTSLLRPR